MTFAPPQETPSIVYQQTFTGTHNHSSGEISLCGAINVLQDIEKKKKKRVHSALQELADDTHYTCECVVVVQLSGEPQRRVDLQ